ERLVAIASFEVCFPDGYMSVDELGIALGCGLKCNQRLILLPKSIAGHPQEEEYIAPARGLVGLFEQPCGFAVIAGIEGAFALFQNLRPRKNAEKDGCERPAKHRIRL